MHTKTFKMKTEKIKIKVKIMQKCGMKISTNSSSHQEAFFSKINAHRLYSVLRFSYQTATLNKYFQPMMA